MITSIIWLMSFVTLLASFLLFFAPRYRNYYLLPARVVVPLGYTGIVVGKFFSYLIKLEPAQESPFPQVVINFFIQNPEQILLTILGMNLFVAAWVAEQSELLGINKLIQVFVLLFCILFAPVGLAVFYLVSLRYYLIYVKKMKD